HGWRDHAPDLPRCTVSTRHGLSRSHARPGAFHTPVTGAPVLHSTSLRHSLPGQSVRGYGAAHPPRARTLPHHPVNESPLPSEPPSLSPLTIAGKGSRGNKTDRPSQSTPMIEFIPIKSWAARGSGAPGNCAGHSRAPSPDRGRPPSTGGSGLSQSDSA